MAYCRMGTESDVYVYASITGGIHCCGCRLRDDDGPTIANDPLEMLDHLNLHLDAGHDVPTYAIERLRSEVA